MKCVRQEKYNVVHFHNNSLSIIFINANMRIIFTEKKIVSLKHNYIIFRVEINIAQIDPFTSQILAYSFLIINDAKSINNFLSHNCTEQSTILNFHDIRPSGAVLETKHLFFTRKTSLKSSPLIEIDHVFDEKTQGGSRQPVHFPTIPFRYVFNV